MSDDDPLSPQRLIGLALPPERLRALAAEYAMIREEIEKLRGLDLGETHPAVVFRPPLPPAGRDGES